MGEYAIAKATGAEVKIGTCEDMYYLRADQADQVSPLPRNVDPIAHAAEIRFRFPWPDEDGCAPGEFRNHDRAVAVWGIDEDISPTEHYNVQFKAGAGYLVSLPCPEGAAGATDGLTTYLDDGLKVARNGFIGRVRIVQQRVWDGRLVLVCECACGARYRLERWEDAEQVVAACRSMAEEEVRTAERAGLPPAEVEHAGHWWHTVADRITDGYHNPPAWVSGPPRAES